MQRDKANLDIFWLRDESLEDADNLPDPDVIAAEIIEDLRRRARAVRVDSVGSGAEDHSVGRLLHITNRRERTLSWNKT